jgi:hypothetical protein
MFQLFIYFRGMLQLFYMFVAKIDRDVGHVAVVVHVCCKCLFQIFHLLFLDVCCKCLYLDVAYVSHICCKSMFEMFQPFRSYVAISVFILQIDIL